MLMSGTQGENDFAIRKAVPQDAPRICELIRELADYERLAHAAIPDTAALAQHLSTGAQPQCHAVLALDALERSIGFALYFHNYSTFLTNWGIHLEDLFVEPAYRGRGVGEALLSAVGKEAVALNCRRLELSVLDWNSSAIAFYLNRGATALDDWTTMRFEGDALRGLAATRPAR